MKPKKVATKSSADISMEELKMQYDGLVPLLERLRLGLVEQLEHVVKEKSLYLAFPIESRIKSWSSIAEKIRRKSLKLGAIKEIPDLVGIRVVFLFLRDLKTACTAIPEIFRVENQENVVDRLGDTQFGYQSVHHSVRIPQTWTTVPTFSGCGQLVAEVQARTIAQHTWAAASHLLQYKQETGIPFEVRRSIHRVSALLETVDLEFERVLTQREHYLTLAPDDRSSEETLNVDLLASLLDEMLPPENRVEDEIYDELLYDLNSVGVNTLGSLRALIEKHLPAALAVDRRQAKDHLDTTDDIVEYERYRKGAYFYHVGLVRQILDEAKIYPEHLRA